MLAHEVPAQQRGQPVAVGVAARRPRSAWRRRTPRPRPSPGSAPGGSARRPAGTARRRPRAAPGGPVLADSSKSSARSYSCTRNSLPASPTTSVRPYCATPGPLDRVDDLEGSSTTTPRGHVQEGAAAPEGGVGGLELVAVDRQALGVPAARPARGARGRRPPASTGSRRARASAGSSSTLRRPRPRSARSARRAARSGSVRVTTSGTARRAGAVRSRAVERSSASRSRLCRLVVQKPERRQTGSSEALVRPRAPPRAAAPACGRRRRPRRRARGRGSPRGGGRPSSCDRRRAVGAARVRRRQALIPPARRRRRPPGGSGRSPRARGARPARRRPRARSARPSGCARTAA